MVYIRRADQHFVFVVSVFVSDFFFSCDRSVALGFAVIQRDARGAAVGCGRHGCWQ